MTLPGSTFGGGFRPGLVKVERSLGPFTEFLASEKYMVKNTGITLASSLVAAAGDGTKLIKAGTVLGKLTAGAEIGKYAPYADAGTDGLDTAVGLLFAGDINLQWGDVTASLMIGGSVWEARVTGLTAAAKTDLAPHFIFQ